MIGKVKPLHDPNINFQIIEKLSAMLFGSDDRRLKEWIDRLLKKNNECLACAEHSFLYNGEVFRQSNVVGRMNPPRLLHGSLTMEIEALLKDRAIVDDNRRYIKQTLVNLLEPCTTKQDVRDTLPECLVTCLPELQPMSRQREAAFTIQDKPRAVRQYEKILPMMESYSAARLIF